MAYPYVFLDATYVKARVTTGWCHGPLCRHWGHRRRAREVLGLSVGDSEDRVFWTEFLRACANAGLRASRS